MTNKYLRETPVLTEAEKQELQRWCRHQSIGQALAQRARIILLSAQGKNDIDVAKELSTTRETVGKWRRRFIKDWCDSLLDEARPGAPRQISDEQVEHVITLTLESTPKDATHWSTRSMAKATGLSQSAVSRIWRAFVLKPHRVTTFKLSTDPFFTEKVRDIVGLYMNPPEKAVVLCVDEKSQIQALNRTQPILQLRPGLPQRQTHDYERHGTTSLFAALNVATGKVIGHCYKHHRSIEFRQFLKTIDQNVPKEQDIHVVLDNYGTHKTAMIYEWLVKHPRFHLHFTPTSSSWLNLVERWFGLITDKAIRRGSFSSVKELENTIKNYVETNNDDPKPFIWTKTADQIFDSLKIYCEEINNSAH